MEDNIYTSWDSIDPDYLKTLLASTHKLKEEKEENLNCPHNCMNIFKQHFLSVFLFYQKRK